MPNVSYCEDNNEVHYNPIVPETRLVVKYNVTDTSSETTLLFDTTPFIDMEIDGVIQSNIVSSYTFNTLGIHTVKYTLVDPTTIGCYYDGVDYLSYFDGAPTTEVIIPDSVTSIGDYAFYYCTGLTSVTIGDNVTSIGDIAFEYCSGLTSVTIGSGVTSIGNSAFWGCSGLISVTIPDSVTSIGGHAFRYCSGLTSVTIPNSVTSINDNTFNGCSSLTSITIPDEVTTFGSYAFYQCTSLTTITIPNSVTSIGTYAFWGCSGLISVTSLATIAPTITNSTFQNIKTGGTLYVPTGSNYSSWMSSSNYYLGKYGWTKVEQ